MYRISLIIGEVYQKYLRLAEQNRVQLNLDLGENNEQVDNPKEIQQELEKHLDSALQRSAQGEITVSIKNHQIIITDSGTVLSGPICALLSKGRVTVKSRVGFGTSVRINLEGSASEPNK